MPFDLDQGLATKPRSIVDGMTHFTTKPLLPHEIGRAFPLVQLMLPSIDQRHWDRFARRFLRSSGRRGILSVRDHRGHIRGLAIFRRQLEIAGQVLLADPVLFVDLLNPADVGLALIAALEAKAREFGCEEVRVNMPDHHGRDWALPAGAAHIEMRRRFTAALPASG